MQKFGTSLVVIGDDSGVIKALRNFMDVSLNANDPKFDGCVPELFISLTLGGANVSEDGTLIEGPQVFEGDLEIDLHLSPRVAGLVRKRATRDFDYEQTKSVLLRLYRGAFDRVEGHLESARPEGWDGDRVKAFFESVCSDFHDDVHRDEEVIVRFLSPRARRNLGKGGQSL